MKSFKTYVPFVCVVLSLLIISCSDDSEPEDQELRFCASASWNDGLACSTRTLSHTDLFTESGSSIGIAIDDYPQNINVHCTDGKDFLLTKGTTNCTAHSEYWDYSADEDVVYYDLVVKARNLTFTATATIDDEDELRCVTTKDNIQGTHLQFTLHHTKALLRFAFKVDEKYDKLRYIKITNIKVNGSDATLRDIVLNKDDSQIIAYIYVDPEVVTTKSITTLQCLYDIYDKDADLVTPGADNSAHITRKDVTATNTFKLGSIKDASSKPVSVIQSGYYYDINVTLNPDYLYVLSEHDNEHLTIK